MDTKSYRVSVGNPNIVINRKDYEEKALLLGLSESTMEELSDSELQRWVTLKELKDYAEEVENTYRDDLSL